MKEWRHASEFGTLKWIKILVKQRKRKLELAQLQVKDREKIAQTFVSSCLFSKWMQVLENNVKKDEDTQKLTS